MTKMKIEPQTESLVRGIFDIFERVDPKCLIETEITNQLIEELVIYLTRREQRIFDHAHKIGKSER
jgi:hypothetical protein